MFTGATFADRLAGAVKERRSNLIVGLDPQFRFMPIHLRETAVEVFGLTFEAIGQLFATFNRAIIDHTLEFAAAYKLQMAFYEHYGHWGVWAFEQTVAYLRSKGVLIIEDAKRGDGGDTADAYANGHLGKVDFWDIDRTISGCLTGPIYSPIHVDCMTVQPYIGDDCVSRFVRVVKEYGAGIFVLTKSSFRPNSRVEQLVVQEGMKVWEAVAYMVEEWGKGTEGECGYRNVGVVMGATFPGDAPRMRQILPNVWFLIPGYGGQGGTADEAVVGINEDGLGGGVNSSRGIIYAYQKGQFQTAPEKFAGAAAKAARAARDELNEALKRAGKWVY